MAMDVALCRCLPEDEGVLRIYRWARPTLSLGRNQPARCRYDPLAARSLGADVVRRPTGGREVLHDRELTYSVALPLRSLGGIRDAYRVFNRALVGALRSLDVPAESAALDLPVPPLDSGPCFQAPMEGEVTARGRKLVGSAQARIGKALLQHGSLLLAPPSLPLESLRAPPVPGDHHGAACRNRDPGGNGVPRSSPEAITLAELIAGPVGFHRVAAAVEAAIAGAVGGGWQRDRPSARELEVAEALLPHYESPGWTWRR